MVGRASNLRGRLGGKGKPAAKTSAGIEGQWLHDKFQETQVQGGRNGGSRGGTGRGGTGVLGGGGSSKRLAGSDLRHRLNNGGVQKQAVRKVDRSRLRVAVAATATARPQGDLRTRLSKGTADSGRLVRASASNITIRVDTAGGGGLTSRSARLGKASAGILASKVVSTKPAAGGAAGGAVRSVAGGATKGNVNYQPMIQFLNEIGLSKYAGLLVKEEVDLAALGHISDNDLKLLGVPMGPRRKLLAAIKGSPKAEKY
mmetsp:Transcript_10981/g.12981  ORF Transcript_10981/g.12981 Transcript_10981/m.12981 type:complete len:258 (-) Transcript_10981:110-883(-)|eukprot:CAMPEP_0197843592 /NCGR_PEP_ID=MMETSP1438-20131217/481_1 /TAXON_ID=1461541 /ORGANISM="Pterosperma sp., Strain CCMP1384" /LENGTH=257 /DNA_ID=CAMNT_0043453825 /DNA_START=270 /DNA_END=1043 /DNA_ORIENTATION=-